METLLILLFLFAMRDPSARETVNSLLAFYRENRDLIASLTKNGLPMSAAAPSESAPQKESRPREEVGDNKIIEEYLSRLKG